MDKPLFEVGKTETVSANPWVGVSREQFVRTFDGLARDYTVINRRIGVVVAAVNAAMELVMIHKPVYAMNGYSLELPGGGVDAGEDALTAAKRELEEETGATAVNWQHAGKSWPHTDTERHYADVFVAEGAIWKDVHEGDKTEAAERLMIPLREAVEKCTRGEIVHSHSIIGILQAARILGV